MQEEWERAYGEVDLDDGLGVITFDEELPAEALGGEVLADVPEEGAGWDAATACAEGGVDAGPEAERDSGADVPYVEPEATSETVAEETSFSPGDLSPRELGRRGEAKAASWLEDRGWCVLERNWRCRYGEADLIALHTEGDDDTVALVEVKTRLCSGPDSDVRPEAGVNEQKRRRYRLMGLCYLSEHPETPSVRFDVVAINVNEEGRASLHYVPDAFTGDGH